VWILFVGVTGKVETTTRALQDSRAMATHVDPVGFVTFSDIVTAQTAAQVGGVAVGMFF
jgi:hypothetical protein